MIKKLNILFVFFITCLSTHPLLYASQNSDNELHKLVQNPNAEVDVFKVTLQATLPLESRLSFLNQQDQNGFTVVYAAAAKKKWSFVECILNNALDQGSAKLDVEARPQGMLSILQRAINDNQSPELIKQLLSRGAKATQEILVRALKNKSPHLIEYAKALVNAGAPMPSTIQVSKNQSQKTSLWISNNFQDPEREALLKLCTKKGRNLKTDMHIREMLTNQGKKRHEKHKQTQTTNAAQTEETKRDNTLNDPSSNTKEQWQKGAVIITIALVLTYFAHRLKAFDKIKQLFSSEKQKPTPTDSEETQQNQQKLLFYEPTY